MRTGITFACALALACGPARPRPDGEGDEGGDGESGDGEGGESPPPPEEEVRTRPSEMLDRLRNAGPDPASLPPLDSLSMEQKRDALMPAFARSLGVQCTYCHEYGNYAAPTRYRAVAKQMYEDFVRRLRMADGTPLFCDSCHQRQSEFLPEGREVVSRFMRENYVRPLERIDAGDHGCDTCHGDPPRWEFLPTTPG